MSAKADRTAKLLTNAFEVGDKVRCGRCAEFGTSCGLDGSRYCRGTVEKVEDDVPWVRWRDAPMYVERVNTAGNFLVLEVDE